LKKEKLARTNFSSNVKIRGNSAEAAPTQAKGFPCEARDAFCAKKLGFEGAKAGHPMSK